MKTLFALILVLPKFALAAGIEEGVALCRKISADVDPRVAYEQAQELYPEDPVRRALFIRQHYGSTAVPFYHESPTQVTVHRGRNHFNPVTYDWLYPQTVSGNHPSIWAYPDMELNTVRYASPNDLWWHGNVINSGNFRFKKFNLLPRQRSRFVVSWTHGLTGVISNAGRIFSQLKVMNGVKTDGNIHKALVDAKLWLDTTAVGADMPFHGAGPFDPALSSLEGSLGWRKRYYHSLAQHTDQGLVAASRSGESLFLGQLAHDNPGLFQGMIWMSPMHPVAGFNETINGYKVQNVDTGVEINPHALRWFANACEEMHGLPAERRWWESERGVPNVPTLVIVGEKDPEVPQATRAYYKELARRNPDIFFYVEVPGAGHDPFSVTENWVGSEQAWSSEAEARAIGAWKYVYWFLENKVQKKSPPNLGWLHQ